MKMKPVLLACGLRAAGALALPAARAAAPAPRPAAPAAPAPKLVVIMAVDGLNYDRLVQYRPWYVAGLKRLLDEGRVFSKTNYRHINTETGPGHSSIGVGAPPRVTGIVGNRWTEQNADGSLRSVSCAAQWDPNRIPGNPPLFYSEVEKDGRLLVFAQKAELERWQASGEIGKATTRVGAGPAGETVVFDSDDAILLFNLRHGRPSEEFAPKGTIAGPGNLRVPTFGDRLVAARPGARVVSISAKDRSAAFMAGRDPRHVVYWYDKENGRFTTSTAYDTAGALGALGKSIVTRFNREKAGALLPARFGLLWRRLPPRELAPGLPMDLPQARAGIGDYSLPAQGVGFDHDLSKDPEGYFNGVYVSPFIDELVADLGLELLQDGQLALGRGSQPDLFAISFSAQDVVSHSHGAESEENLDTLRRLDIQVGRVLAALDRLYPKGSVLLGFSADHGFTPIPEVYHRDHPGESAGRLVNSPRVVTNLFDRLNRMLSEQLCLAPGSKPLYGNDGWSVSFNRPLFPARTVEGPCGPAGQAVTLDQVGRAFRATVKRVYAEEIADVYLIAERESWRDDDPVVEFLRNGLDLERSGDAFMVPRRNVIMHWDPARGTTHGSHHDYDTHVPLIFWGGSAPAGVSEEPATPYDLAPTLAAALGVALLDATGRPRLPR